MNILVTGGAGFIGSNFVNYMLRKHPDYFIVNLDSLTYAGNLENLKEATKNSNYAFVNGDIRKKKLVRKTIKNFEITHVINFAAESHVDRSINNPEIFFETNILGTLNLLEASKEFEVEKYLQVSTDEVYGSLGEEGFFTEDSPLAPNSPYSASKTGADLLVRSYYETYGLNINITRCSNNYGKNHFPEKLIPLMITNGIDLESLPIYGDGKNIRDWLHVEDHCLAIDLVLHNGKSGEIYNIGGHNEKTNKEIVEIIAKELELPEELIVYVDDRLGHDKRYAIDPTKIENELGWKPKYTFEVGILETIEWYKNNESWWRPLKERAKL